MSSEEYIEFDFRELKYQQNPGLIIEACLHADDPLKTLLEMIMTLDMCGYQETAHKVWMLCPKYGIDIESVVWIIP